MASEAKVLLDPKSVAILNALQRDARVTFAELGRQVGLSAPAVAERVRRLEEAGIIRGYGARLDLEALGYSVTALIEVAAPPGRYPQVLAYAEAQPEVRECYFVTGESSFVARVVARSIAHLHELVQGLGQFGATRTSVVLSRPLIKDVFLLEDPTDT